MTKLGRKRCETVTAQRKDCRLALEAMVGRRINFGNPEAAKYLIENADRIAAEFLEILRRNWSIRSKS